ncbi:tyrosine-type recombinase/integrase [uncultured Clostridium sp.]|uniref:tyrosine-type recombinase/integrase n=1 Tax=uncultured Clostridium sp. TaxID=59620 RepID=UPI00260667F9|nr:tyrosine-type recombinase/integrase [uncultured Clostridium sp.]
MSYIAIEDVNIIENSRNIKEKLKSYSVEVNSFKILKGVEFQDALWDFSDFNTLNRESVAYKFNFEYVNGEFLNYIKLVILEEFMYGTNKIQTIHKDFDIMKTFTNECVKLGIEIPGLINDNFLEEYILDKEKKCKYNYLARFLNGITKLVKLIYEIKGSNDSRIIDYIEMKKAYYRKFKTDKVISKYIPDEFLNKMVSLAIRDSKDEQISITNRIFCNLLIIVAETGMRIEELCLLETGKLEEIKVGEHKVSYLNFISTKSESKYIEKRETYCCLTELSSEAYKRAESLVDELISRMSMKARLRKYRIMAKKKGIEIGEINESNYRDVLSEKEINKIESELRKFIFIGDSTYNKIMNTDSLTDYLKRFFIRNYNEFKEIHERYKDSVPYFKIESKTIYEKFCGSAEKKSERFDEVNKKKFPLINFHRFRVTVCSKMYKKGIPLDFIREHMNHMYEDMTCQYIKTEKKINEMEENIEILNSITDENGYIDAELKNSLEDKNIEEKIKKINKFLKKKNINIKTDITKILEILEKTNSTAVENEFGVCVKAVISGVCKKRKYFNSGEKNYYIGLELDTFKFIDLNYERFLQKKSIIEHNKKIVEKNKELEFELNREIKNLKYFLNKTLIKEIKLLEDELRIKGENKVIEENRQIRKIVLEIEKIKDEVEEWIQS